MLVLASIPSDKAYLLKFVLPNINFRGEGDQVFSPEGSSLEGYSLTVKQSQAGFSLSSPGGLANFLLEIGLITSSKAESLQKRELQSMKSLFMSAARLIVQGRVPARKTSDEEFVMKILKDSLSTRFEKANQIGFTRVMKTALTVLERRFTANVFKSLNRAQKLFYADLTATFRKDLFLLWSLTGDAETDCIQLLSFF